MFRQFDDFMIDAVFCRLARRFVDTFDALELSIIALVASLGALIVAVAGSLMSWLLVVFAMGFYLAIMSRIFVIRREQVRPTLDFDFRAKDRDLRAVTAALAIVLIIVDRAGHAIGWPEPGVIALLLFAVSNWFAACSESGRGDGRRSLKWSLHDNSKVVRFPGHRPI